MLTSGGIVTTSAAATPRRPHAPRCGLVMNGAGIGSPETWRSDFGRPNVRMSRGQMYKGPRPGNVRAAPAVFTATPPTRRS
jgi:hypothetical protein